MENRQLEILRRLQEGEIDADEAAALLGAVGTAEESPAGEAIGVVQGPARRPEGHWAHFWIYPFAVGAALLALGALCLTLVYGAGAGWGCALCGWPVALLGLAAVLLALWSRRARWLHLRVKEAEGKKVAISFPLPLTLAAWVVRIAQPFVPKLRETGVDDLIVALSRNPHDEPLSIQVDEGEGGDKVDIYIG
jgi:hypothetical protein